MERTELVKYIRSNPGKKALEIWENNSKFKIIDFEKGEGDICIILADSYFQIGDYKSSLFYLNQAIRFYKVGTFKKEVRKYLDLKLSIADVQGNKFNIYRTLLLYKYFQIADSEHIETINHIESYYYKRINSWINFGFPAIVIGLIGIDYLLNQIGYNYFKGLLWIAFLALFVIIMVFSLLFNDTFKKTIIYLLRAVANGGGNVVPRTPQSSDSGNN